MIKRAKLWIEERLRYQLPLYEEYPPYRPAYEGAALPFPDYIILSTAPRWVENRLFGEYVLTAAYVYNPAVRPKGGKTFTIPYIGAGYSFPFETNEGLRWSG